MSEKLRQREANDITAADVVGDDLILKRYDGTTLLVSLSSGFGVHPDLSAHDDLGLSTDEELDVVVAALEALIATKVPTAQSINAQTGTAYTLVSADQGKLVTLSNAAPITLTLPRDSDASYAIGVYTDLLVLGAGQVTVVAGTGAVLHTSGLTAKSRATKSRLGVQKISADNWSLFGDLAAS